ncbi:MAG: phosphatidylserine decarboxylase family protein [Bacteroidetes bacterium]|nr:MAG: phosphatidylserine decarboxylase family protein [Bacteroidota bacterium]TDI74304.1 MAG: phosphatidylserine decarboxylase family protein [Bacteroidota bacterium]TDI77741.1 MAG: phosphatidylserine decarboxylase family protein [Bacteroidota bacterium]
MFHKEGHKIIVITFIITVVLSLLVNHFVTTEWLRISLLLTFMVLLVAILQFFRNPKRSVTPDEDHILSPVDGKVVVIEEVFEKEYFKEKRLQISVFMSPLNVHVTRFPVGGNIVFSEYHSGKYLVAWHPKSSEENERTTVVINTDRFGDILYRQIAGAMAKRIVNYAQEGEHAVQADESGFIKFGSRVDVFLPLDAKVKVSLNEKVKGGISILATK